MGKAKVTGFRIGELEISVDSDGSTLPEIFRELDLRMEGSAVFINGTRVAGGASSPTRVYPDDQVEVTPKGEGGC